MTPILRWAGSKRKNLSRLGAYWRPEYRRYVEPFAGSACLFFHLEPKAAVIADLNAQLIGAYQAIVEDPERVHALAKQWRNDSETYYEVRGTDVGRLDIYQRAARFLYLNRFCFNGIWRTNLRGDFNVPYGGERSGQIPEIGVLKEASRLLARANLRSCDFEEVVSGAKPKDFFYLDPPYQTAQRRVFKEYTAKDFGGKDVERLQDALRFINDKGAFFVLSYGDCREARILARGFHSHRIVVRRNVAGFADHRRQACELVVTNIPPDKNETPEEYAGN